MICKFYVHLLKSPSRIVQEVVNTDKALAAEGFPSYFSYIERIFDFLGMKHLLYMCDTYEVSNQVEFCLEKTLTKLYDKQWISDRILFSSNSNLEFFSEVKSEFEFAEYLDVVKNPNHRAALTKVRISAHKYPIETGRYSKLKREERECPLCCREIGDEEHCILRCLHPFLTDTRCSITASLSSLKGYVLESTDDMDELCYLLKNKDKEIMHLTSKLCFKIQEMFQELTY